MRSLSLNKKVASLLIVLSLVILTPIVLSKTALRQWITFNPKPSEAASFTQANTPFSAILYIPTPADYSNMATSGLVLEQPYSYEITNGQINLIHSNNPNTKVVRYQSGVEAFNTGTNFSDPQTWSLGFVLRLNSDSEWNDIWTNHKSWILKDSGGQYVQRVSSASYSMNPQRAYLMDPANLEWREWLSNKVAQKISYGYDGVFLDLCLPAPNYWSAIPAKYVNNYGIWRHDLNGMINYVKSKNPGALIYTNSSWRGQDYYDNSSSYPIDDNNADGTEIEGFIYASGNGPIESQSAWLNEVKLVKKLGDENKSVLARTVLAANDTMSPSALLAYSLSTFLLGKSGDKAYFRYHSYKTGFDNVGYVNSVYSLPLGDPTNTYYQQGISYQRDFTNGKVIVNPNDSNQTYVYTPTSTKHYVDQNGTIVDSSHPVSLTSKTGVILINSAQNGDVNGDGHVTIADLSVLALNFGKTSGANRSQGDLNNDGQVNISDLSILAINWGA